MNYEIKLTKSFLKSLKALSKRYRSIKEDLSIFSESLKDNPFQGVELSPGIRKIRMAISSKGKGKSGGARVITMTTIISEESGKIVMVAIYDKSDQETVDVEVIKRLIKELEL
ncbi:MAG: addiction module toxin RelE [Muribaculaceae bacterium]|nr:addiction module toxin RelE [Muribaculaceae bacterium]